MLEILDSITDAGSSHRSNEDRCGAAGAFAWVIDGATGVAEGPLVDPQGSDAAWLAATASQAFERFATAPEAHSRPLAEVVRATIEELGAAFEAQRLREPKGRYEWPSAGFLLVSESAQGLRFANLGDCSLLVAEAGRGVRQFGAPRRSGEGEAAKKLKVGGAGFADAHFSPETLDHLRKARNRQNTEGGYWILGLDPRAADHMREGEIALEQATLGLLMSDGFAALADDYRRYSSETLITAAADKGLGVLLEELRRIERVEDPKGVRYPRFKQADDATALLFRWRAGPSAPTD